MRSRAVHLVEVHGGIDVGLTARQEDDAGDVRGHVLVQDPERRLGDLHGTGLRRGAGARQHHVHLEERARQVDAMLRELRVQRAQRPGGRRPARLDRVVAVHQDLRLHDRDDAGLLAERRVARHRVRVREDGEVGGDVVADEDRGAPLGEPRPELPVVARAARGARRAPR